MKESRHLVIDNEPEDQSQAEAARYMRRILDGQIADAWASQKNDALRVLLAHRYGEQLAQAIDFTKKQSLESALIDAFTTLNWPPLNLPSGCVFCIPWDAPRARQWFRAKLHSEWPAGLKVEFLSADLHTLWTVCRALELAKPRDYELADDPFPAPPILLLGPTGTGKELLAQAIHLKSGQKKDKFGALNCGGLPEQLLESELFGYVKNAFTGATTDKPGFVESYETLFLDEIGDTPMTLQIRLLRFLNSGEFRRVGSVKASSATPRIIAATHVDLEEKIKSKEFREDLYYRLRGNVLRLRPLKEQGGLIPHLFMEFITAEASRRRLEGPKEMTNEAHNALRIYSWPGNMRELKYHVESLLTKRTNIIQLEHLADEVVHNYRQRMSSDNQDLLHLVSHSDLGGDAQHLALRAEWLMNERYKVHHQEWISNQSAAGQLAQFIEDIAETFELSQHVKELIHALRATASAESVKTFKNRWLSILTDATSRWHADYSLALETCEKALSELEEREQSQYRELMGKARGAALSQPLQAALLSLLPLLNHLVQGEKGLGALFVSFVKKILGEASDIADLFAKLDGLSQEDVMEHFIDMFDLSAGKPSWDDLKDDPDALHAFVENCGTQKEAARILEVAPKTVSRHLKKSKNNM